MEFNEENIEQLVGHLALWNARVVEINGKVEIRAKKPNLIPSGPTSTPYL